MLVRLGSDVFVSDFVEKKLLGRLQRHCESIGGVRDTLMPAGTKPRKLPNSVPPANLQPGYLCQRSIKPTPVERSAALDLEIPNTFGDHATCCAKKGDVIIPYL